MNFRILSKTAESLALSAHLAATAASCGKPGSTAGTGRSTSPDKISAANLDEARQIAQRTEVSCFDDRGCSPAVAFLAAAWPDGVTVCTGFLIGSDILATNSHCLPSDIERSGASCSGRLWAFFPDLSGARAETLECDSVLSASGHSETQAGKDFAFLKLSKPSSRDRLITNRDGFADGAKLTLMKFNPNDGEIREKGYPIGTMQSVACQSIQHSSRLPSFDDPKSPVVALGDCEVVKGNSGAPLLDSQGQARGLIQAFFEPPKVESAALLRGDPKRMALGTSLACIQLPGEAGDYAFAACNELPGAADDRHAADWEAEVKRRLTADADRISGDWGASRQGVRWRSAPLETASALIPASLPRTQYDRYFVPQPWCVAQARPGSFQIQLPLYRYREGYNEYMQPSFTGGQSAGSIAASLMIAPESGGFSAELSAQDSQGNRIRISIQRLHQCE